MDDLQISPVETHPIFDENGNFICEPEYMVMPENYAEILKEREEIEAYNRKLEEKAEKRAERVRRCGRPIHRLDPATGMRVKVVPHCDNWHECPNCRELRVEAISSLVALVVSGGPTWVMKCKTGDENDRLATEEGKASYLSFPLEKPDEQGNNLLILVDHPVAQATPVRLPDLRSWDMANVACTPEGRRLTGHLRKPKGVAARAGETVRLLTFTTEAPEAEVSKAFTAAVLETTGADPKNPREVEEANYKRVSLWAAILREAGYVTSCSYQPVKLTVLSSWVSCTFNFLVQRGLVIPRRAPKCVGARIYT